MGDGLSGIGDGDARLRRRLGMRAGGEEGAETTDAAGDKGGLTGAQSIEIEIGGGKALAKDGGAVSTIEA
jgi:hypothetical protein